MQEFNLGLDTIVEFLQRNGSPIERSPVAKLTEREVELLRKEYSSSAQEKKEASGISIGHKHHEKIVIEGDSHKDRRRHSDDEIDEAPVARRNLQAIPGIPKRPAQEVPVAPPSPVPSPVPAAPVAAPAPPPAPVPAPVQETPAPEPVKAEPEAPSVIKAEGQVQGLKVLGKIDLGARKKAPAAKPAVEAEVKPAPVPAELPKVEKPEIIEAVKPEAPVAPVIPEPAPAPAAPKEKIESPAPEAPAVVPVVNTLIKGEADQLKGLTVLGKIDLKVFENKPKSSDDAQEQEKRKRKRLKSGPVAVGGSNSPGSRPAGQGGEGGFRQGGGPGGNAPQQGGGQNRPGGQGGGQNRPGGQGGGQNRPGGGGGYSNRQISGQVKATMNKGCGNQSPILTLIKLGAANPER